MASIGSGIGENMEDRYLFKAKRLDNGEWVQGNLIQSCDATDGWESIIIPVKNSNMFTKHIGQGYGNLGFENWYRVNPSTICQCTGLKDETGKLIWENDIVRDKHGNCYKAFWQNNYYQFSWICVKSDIFSIGVKWDLWSFKGFEIEVIGNIFDNKELLESEEK